MVAVEIIGEGEAVERAQPAVIGVAAVIGKSFDQHEFFSGWCMNHTLGRLGGMCGE
jgi:K+-transporting ATPase c subunit